MATCSATIQSRLRSDRGVLIVGTAVANAINVLTVLAISRLYPVSRIGEFYLFTSFLAAPCSVAAGRLETAVLLPVADAVRRVVALGLYASLAVGALTCTAAVVLSELGILGPDLARVLSGHMPLVFFAVFGTGVFNLTTSMMLRTREFKILSAQRVRQVVYRGCIQIGSGFLNGSLLGLILGDIIGRSSGFLLLLKRYVRWRDLWPTLRSRTELLSALKEFWRFPTILLISTLINTLGYTLPILLLVQKHGATTSGWLAMVDRLMNVPLMLVGTAISQTYSSSAASCIQNRDAALLTMFKHDVRRLTSFAVPCFLIVGIVSPAMYALVLGPEWRGAGEFARIYAPMNAVAFVCWPFMSTFALLKMEGAQLAWDCGRMILCVALVYAANKISNAPIVSVAAYSAGMTLAYLAYLSAAHRVIRRKADFWSNAVSR